MAEKSLRATAAPTARCLGKQAPTNYPFPHVAVTSSREILRCQPERSVDSKSSAENIRRRKNGQVLPRPPQLEQAGSGEIFSWYRPGKYQEGRSATTASCTFPRRRPICYRVSPGELPPTFYSRRPRLLRRRASESGRLRHGDGRPRTGRASVASARAGRSRPRPVRACSPRPG